jgi:uncharacterized membrane protein YhhN
MRIALAISLLCSAVYTIAMPFGRHPVIKAGAVAALAVLARRYPLAAVALLLGSAGDALLEIGPEFFVAGLAAFLCGHVVYTFCFIRTGKRPISAIAAAGVVLFACAFTAWLWPHLGALRIPVALYIAAISAMAITSFRLGGTVPAGALLFLASDSLLAANRFVTPLPAAGYAIWLTYYAAQFLIAFGFYERGRPGMISSRFR